MALSPSLSRKLRAALGDDAGGDLVTWLDEERDARANLADEVAGLREDMHAMELRISRQFHDIAAQIADVKSDLMKWSCVFWCGSVAAIAALAGVLRQ
jgi:hypothetical protein